MRIITGKARGIKLVTPEGEMTRPTAERTKEAIFSMIQFDIEGRRVLDLFAGSGQLGLEALSRGAAEAVMVDQSKEAVRVIKQNVEKTKLTEGATVICAEFAEFLRGRRGAKPFDIIFLDPPYAMHAVSAAITALEKAKLIKSTTKIVCESEEPSPIGEETDLAKRYTVLKSAKYGKAYVTVLTPRSEEGEA
ncbi:MAG: 16S rRNA (guanine(966)-N(2))-methyltransferase RsmD [Ruminococcaceae bacterium]|nr:16S rRNA (guanine(966)-N(2))-methyltransferase RsmD [Oscillospiraceae bacterium]